MIGKGKRVFNTETKIDGNLSMSFENGYFKLHLYVGDVNKGKAAEKGVNSSKILTYPNKARALREALKHSEYDNVADIEKQLRVGAIARYLWRP